MTQGLENIPGQDDPADPAIAWFSRWRSGQMTEAQLDAMEEWLRAAPDHPKALEDVAAVWDEVEAARRDPGVMALREKAVRSIRRRRTGTLLRRAAAVALFVATGLAGAQWGVSLFGSRSYATGVGEQSTISLRDGSKVTLDTNSEIKVWPSITKRRLQLVRGRAYFQVAKDVDHPFVVGTDRGSVTALGTVFDMRDDADGMKIVLVEGRVRIQPDRSNAVEMTAGNEFVGDGGGWRLIKADAETETSWVKGSLVFRDEPLSAIVGELNRYSTDRIAITDSRIANKRLSAVLKSDDVDAFLNSVQLLNVAGVRRTDAHEIDLVPPA